MAKIPFFDLLRTYDSYKKDALDAIQGVVDEQKFILGKEVEAFEKEMAQRLEVNHTIGVSSGTDAVLIALMALDIGPDDEVITTPFTFFATAGCIARLGAKPIFVDIEEGSFNLNPNIVGEKITERTKAIMPVHLFGQSADMSSLLKICKKHNLHLIEDAAQGIDADYQGIKCGTMGDVGCFSFFPTKNLGAFGDAGLVATNQEPLAEKLRIFRAHGAKPKYFHSWIGGNFRIDALQAAALRVKLGRLSEWNEMRQKTAMRYQEGFARLEDKRFIQTPSTSPGNRHTFHQYVIRAKDRDELFAHMKAQGIGTEIYYPLPLHLQKCFAYLEHRAGDFPEAERASSEVLALPIFPGLTVDEQEKIISAISDFYG